MNNEEINRFAVLISYIASMCGHALNEADVREIRARVEAIPIEPEDIEPQELEVLIADRSATRAANAILTVFAVRRRIRREASSIPSTHLDTPKPPADMRQIFSDGDNTHRFPKGR